MSGPCIATSHEALVLAASRHSKQIWFDELFPIGLQPTIDYAFYNLYRFVSSVNPVPNFFFSLSPGYQLPALAKVRRKGFGKGNGNYSAPAETKRKCKFHAKGVCKFGDQCKLAYEAEIAKFHGFVSRRGFLFAINRAPADWEELRTKIGLSASTL